MMASHQSLQKKMSSESFNEPSSAKAWSDEFFARKIVKYVKKIFITFTCWFPSDEVNQWIEKRINTHIYESTLKDFLFEWI